MKTRDVWAAKNLWDALWGDSLIFRGVLLWEGNPKTDEEKAAFLCKWAGMFKAEKEPAEPKVKKGAAAAAAALSVLTRKESAAPAPLKQPPHKEDAPSKREVLGAALVEDGRTLVNAADIQVGDIVHYWSKYKGGRSVVGRVRQFHRRTLKVDVVPSGKKRAETVLLENIERVERAQ